MFKNLISVKVPQTPSHGRPRKARGAVKSQPGRMRVRIDALCVDGSYVSEMETLLVEYWDEKQRRAVINAVRHAVCALNGKSLEDPSESAAA